MEVKSDTIDGAVPSSSVAVDVGGVSGESSQTTPVKTTIISTIAVQSGKARLVIAILHSGDWILLKILELEPDLTLLGDTLVEALELQKAHNEVLLQLQNKQSPVEELLRQADQLISTQKPRTEVYAAMAESLALAWKDVNAHLEQRRQILDMNVSYHQKADDCHDKMKMLEMACNDTMIPIEIDAVKNFLTNIHDMRRSVLESLMVALQQGTALLDKLKELAEQGTLDSRPQKIKIPVQQAIAQVERWMESLHDRRRLLELSWESRKLQLEQCLALAFLAKDLRDLENIILQRREILNNNDHLGDSAASAELFYNEHDKLYKEAKELQEKSLKITKATEQFVSSGCFAGEQATAQAYGVLDLATQYLTDLEAKMELLTSAIDFFKSAQNALDKLQQMEIELISPNLSRAELIKLHSESEKTIKEIADPPIEAGYALMEAAGRSARAESVKFMVEQLESRKIFLDSLCVAHKEEHRRVMEALDNFLKRQNELHTWLIDIAEAFLQSHQDMGSDVVLAQDFLDLHTQLLRDIQEKGTEINTLLLTLPPILEYLQHNERQDLDKKVENLHERWINIKNILEGRLDLASLYVQFLTQTNELDAAMTTLENSVKNKNEKLNENIISKLEEQWLSLKPLYNKLKALGNQFIEDVHKVSDPHLDSQRAILCVESTLERLANKQLTVSESWQSWQTELSERREILIQWEKNIVESNKTIDLATKLDSELYPIITTSSTEPLHIVSDLEDKLDTTLEEMKRTQKGIEECLRITESLSQKSTEVHNEKVETKLNELNNKFSCDITEYSILTQMIISFFKNINEIQKKIESYKQKYDSEKLSNDVVQTEQLIHEHNSSNQILQEMFNFTQNECDRLISKINKQEPGDAAQKDISRILYPLKQQRNDWDNTWEERRKVLEDHLQLCHFDSDLHQINDTLDDLGKQLNGIKGKYGESLAEAKATSLAFVYFEKTIELLEDRLKQFGNTAENMLKNQHIHSPHIEAELNKLRNRWNEFRTQVQDTRHLIDLSIKYFETVLKAEDWFKEGNQLLRTIARKSSLVKTPVEATELLNEVETFLKPGEQKQDERIHEISKMAFELFGHEQPIQVNKVILENQELTDSFSSIINELNILSNNLKLAEEQRIKDIETQRLKEIEEQRIKEAEELLQKQRAEAARIEAETAKAKADAAKAEADAAKAEADAAKAEAEAAKAAAAAAEEACKTAAKTLNDAAEEFKQKTIVINTTIEKRTLIETQQLVPEKVLITDGTQTTDTVQKSEIIQTEEQVKEPQQPEEHVVHIIPIEKEKSDDIQIEEIPQLEAPRFIVPLTDIIIQEGSSFTFKCHVTGYPLPVIQWFKDGISIESNLDYQTNFENGVCALTIEETFTEDSARFTCKARNAVGSAETSAYLSVKETGPDEQLIPPYFTKTLTPALAREGSKFQFECGVQGNPLPTVQWFKNDTCIDNSSDYIIMYNNGEAVLTFEEVFLEDNATFTCRAENPLGVIESTANLNVEPLEPTEIPSFSVPLSNVMARAGQKIKLECSFTGIPEPKISWTHNGHLLQESHDVKLHCQNNTATLIVPEAFPKDAGIYSAVASNLAGEAVSSCNVTVKGRLPVETSDSEFASDMEPIKPKIQTSLKDVSVFEGSRVRLDCVIVGQPEPEVIWYHDSQPVKESSDFQLLFQGDKCSLIIEEAYLEDAGEYKAVAINSAGEATSSCRLSVSSLEITEHPTRKSQPERILPSGSPPVFTKLLSDVLISEGESVTLECEVTGDPKPDIKWLLNNQEVKEDSRIKLTHDDDGKVILKIEKVTSDDRGVYTIRASNPSGDAKCFSQLIVKSLRSAPEVKPKTESNEIEIPVQVIEEAKTSTEITPTVITDVTPTSNVSEKSSVSLTQKAYTIESSSETTSIIYNNKSCEYSDKSETEVHKFDVHVDEPLKPAEDNKSILETDKKVEEKTIEIIKTEAKPTRKLIPPKFLTPVMGKIIDENTTVVLEGVLEGYPTPTVTWTKNGQTLPENDERISITWDLNKTKIEIKDATSFDAGKYTCQAINDAGSATCTADIVVKKKTFPPVFGRRLQAQLIKKGERVVMEVEVTGLPDPTISWFKDGQPLTTEPNNLTLKSQGNCHTLIIEKASVEHSGKYMVRAVNSSGEAQSIADFAVFEPCPDTMVEVVKTLVFEDAQKLEQLQSSAESSFTKTTQESSTIEKIKTTPEPTKLPISSNIIQTHVSDHKESSYNFETKTIPIISQDSSKVIEHKIETTEKIEQPIPVEKKEPVKIQPIEINKDLTDSRTIIENLPDKINIIDENRSFQHSVKQEISFNIKKHYNEGYKPEISIPEVPQILPQVPQFETKTEIHQESSTTKQIPIQIEPKEEQIVLPKIPDVTPINVVPETPAVASIPIEVPKQEEDERSIIDSSSITKESAYEFFKTKLEENSEPVVDRSHLPEKVQHSYIEFEKAKFTENVPKQEVEEICTRTYVKPPPIDVRTENIIRVDQKSTKTELISEPFNLVPEPPPEIGYMPKAPTETYQREDISHKIKKLESNHQELPSSQIPSGGIKIYPTIPQENNIERKIETTSFLKSEQYTIEKEGPVYRPQADISTRPLTPKPSAEAIEMEKLWIPSKSPEPFITETKSYSYDQQIKEMKSFDSEPGYAASTSSFETLSFSRPHSSLSTSVEKPSAEGIAMEKSWAHKHVGSHAKVWPPPETEVLHPPTATPLWTSNLTESVSQTKQTQEYSSTQYTQKFETSKPITPVPSTQPVQYYRSETSQLQHKMNIPDTTEYSSSKTISSMETNELVVEEKNIKPSEVKKTSTFITKDYELKSPAIVKNIEPKREEIKPLEIIRPISVQDITDEIYLEPGSPPEIAFAEPPPQTRRLSYVEIIEQELEQNLEKVPSKVLPGSIRTIPPPPLPKEKSLPPVLPPRKEKLATPPPLPAKPAFIKPIPSYEPLPPKEFKEEKFSSTSMTSSYVTESSSSIKDIGFRSVKPPATLPRSKSTEPYIQPPHFVTPTIQQTQQIQRPFSTISSTTTHKTFTSHTLPRKKSPPKSLSPINLQPGSPPEYLRAEAPKSSIIKPKLADTGYMADTDEPFIQYKSNMSSTQETSTIQEKHFYHKKVDQKHISRSTAQNHVVKEEKKYVRQNSAPSKTLTAPEIVKKFEIETRIQRDERDSSLEAFPYKPDPPRTKRTKCPPPPSPSKFIKGEFRESDYESDFDGRIQPIWNKGDKHYKPIHPVLSCNNRPQSATKSPIPPTEFDNPPKIDGPPRPKFEPIEKPKQVYSKFHEKSQTTQKQQTLIKPKAISAQLVGSPVTPKTTTLINYIKPGSPPELSYAPPPQKVQYYRSTTSAPYHNATQTETSNIVQFNESTENSHRVVNIQQTTKVIKFGDKPKSKITEIKPQSNNIYQRRGSLPQTPTPSKFIRGEFRESDYESEFESARIRPKWVPGDSDTDEPHYRRVRAPAMHRSSSVPARKERVLTPMEFDTQPPLMPTKITFESTDNERTKKSIRRQFNKDFKQERDFTKVSKIIAPCQNNIQPGSPPEYGYIPSQTVASTATKIATKHMNEMTSTFKSKAQKFAQDIMTDVNNKQQPKQTKSITKGADSDAQVYREESRIAQHGTKHVDPDTGLIYFKYDFGYEFGIVLPGVGKNGEIPQPTKTIIAPPKRDSDIEVPIIHESTDGSSPIKKYGRKVPKYDSESELSEMADTDFNRRKRFNSLPQPSDYSTQNPPYIRIPNTPSPNSLSPSIPSISPAYNSLGYQIETPTSALSSPRNIQSDHIRPSDQPPKPPMFITPLRDIAVIAGKTAKFECIVQAEPTPNIIWTKNGRIIANCSDYQAYYRNGVCRLTIPKAYPGDAGTYNCTATNSQGTASTTANLQVPESSESKKR